MIVYLYHNFGELSMATEVATVGIIESYLIM